MSVTVKHDLWNGDYDLRLDLPEEWQVEVLGMAGSRTSPLVEEDYRKALVRLAETLKGAREVLRMDSFADIVAALEEEHKGQAVKAYVIPDGTIQMPA